MKKLIGAFALAGMIGLTACGPTDEAVVEEPVLEEVNPVPVVVPVNPPAATMPPAMPMDSAASDSAAPATTTP